MEPVYIFDIETEGLGMHDRILEAALVGINPVTLEVHSKVSVLVNHQDLDPTQWSRHVQRMHRKSGLLADLESIRDSGIQPEPSSYRLLPGDGHQVAVTGHRGLDIFLADRVAATCPEGGSVYLVGTSLHFDRKRAEYHLPHFSAFLHYRQVDLRGTLLLLDWWYEAEPPRDDGPAHRALDDCLYVVRALKWLQEKFNRSFLTEE